MRSSLYLAVGVALSLSGCFLFENIDRIQPSGNARPDTQPGDAIDTTGTMDAPPTDSATDTYRVDIEELTACAAHTEPVDNLHFFDATKIKGAPSPLPGTLPLTFWSSHNFWPQGADRREPHRATVMETAKDMRNGRPNVLNIQRWGWQRGTIDKFVNIATWIREANNNLVIGFYDMPPVRNFSQNRSYLVTAVEYNRRAVLGAWSRVWNERGHRIAAKVDAVFPSVFPTTDDFEVWKRYATAKICEAKRYDLPVYAFVGLHYDQEVLDKGAQPVSIGTWKSMLRHVRQLGVEGIAVYTNSKDHRGDRLTWTEDGPDKTPQKTAPWVDAVEQFANQWGGE